jgi:hypothetical protein
MSSEHIGLFEKFCVFFMGNRKEMLKLYFVGQRREIFKILQHIFKCQYDTLSVFKVKKNLGHLGTVHGSLQWGTAVLAENMNINNRICH